MDIVVVLIRQASAAQSDQNDGKGKGDDGIWGARAAISLAPGFYEMGEAPPPNDSVLLPFVVARDGCDSVRDRPDVDHDRDPIDREKEETEAGCPGRDQERKADRHRRAEGHQEDTNKAVTFVNVSKTGNDAERDRDQIARLTFGRLKQTGFRSRRGKWLFG